MEARAKVGGERGEWGESLGVWEEARSERKCGEESGT